MRFRVSGFAFAVSRHRVYGCRRVRVCTVSTEACTRAVDVSTKACTRAVDVSTEACTRAVDVSRKANTRNHLIRPRCTGNAVSCMWFRIKLTNLAMLVYARGRGLAVVGTA
eukprot:2987017-Rhodomonas_salina.1